MSQTQTGAKYGMMTLDASRKDLFQKLLISREKALTHAWDPENLKRGAFPGQGGGRGALTHAWDPENLKRDLI